MKIVIPGGSGQVGEILARAFHAEGHEVVVFSRKDTLERPWRVEHWDGRTLGLWMDELDGADVLINLAGRSVNCRYTAANRRAILDSRVASTRILGAAMSRLSRPPHVWLQASTATIYAHRYDAPNDEATGLIGGHEPDAPATWHFSIEVAKAWERAALVHRLPATRVVLMRSAMTMSPDPGGVFSVFSFLSRRGLGRHGDGRQFVSWIHEFDFLAAVKWLIEHEAMAGPVNLAAPAPLPNAEFLRAIREAHGVRFGLPLSRWMLGCGAFFHRTETELLLKSRRVTPGRLLDAGFTFQFPTWREAARELCSRSPSAGRQTVGSEPVVARL
jgi:hypothetical protein